jgi:hypothetical protein
MLSYRGKLMEIYSIPVELLKDLLILFFTLPGQLQKYFYRHRKYFKKKILLNKGSCGISFLE